ncbi:tail fiber protein [Arsenophonus sp. PmNCSU2021_1]|uniref:tail fiber protein n=1 Tax=Arsenophonus sp. PmNCSU2021_1 TaxID=3118989 RepID=UPI002FEFC038
MLETVNLAKNATPNQRKINGKTLTQDVQLTATDVHAVTPEVLRVEIPVGIPLPWPAERAPTGWFICNGEPFDKKKYPLLALAYPSGKLPDLRGEFIRGWDAGRGVNPRRKVLSSETASLERHAHGYRDRYYVEDDGPLGHANNKEKMPVGYNADTGSRATDGDNDSFLFIDKTTSNAGGSETRPRNVAFNYIVRAA